MRTLRRAVAMALLTLAVPLAAGRAQERSADDSQTRQLWDTKFRESRPPAATAPSARPSVRPSAAPSGMRESFVGVTLWRLRPARSGDESKVTFVLPATGDRWVPERMGVGGSLAEGQHVRMSIESSRSGFLYVIDRERYADGTLGEPWLIYPTTRIREGDNKVTGGRLVEIPDVKDSPPVFTLKRGRSGHVGELLTVIVSPEPLADAPRDRNATRLTPEQVRGWEGKARVAAQKIEMPAAAGKPWSAAEREAGESQSRLLTQEEPLPQTLYRVETAPGQAVLLSVPLTIR